MLILLVDGAYVEAYLIPLAAMLHTRGTTATTPYKSLLHGVNVDNTNPS